MHEFRELMCAVSLRTFCGHYVSDEAVKKIADDYYLITAALELVNFPIIIPFTKTWYGKKASEMVMVEFSKASAQSKERMEAGEEPSCIMDAWIRNMVLSKKWREAEATGDFTATEGLEKPSPLLRDFTDYEIAQTIFTFLFASQDATSSASIWLFQTVAQRPEVCTKKYSPRKHCPLSRCHTTPGSGVSLESILTIFLWIRSSTEYVKRTSKYVKEIFMLRLT